MSSEDDAIRLKLANYMATRPPQALALGFELLSVGAGRGSIRVPWREDLVGDPDTGVIAGGVVTTLLDHLGGLAMHASSRDRIITATLDLRIDYMRAAAPRRDVIGEAHCYKLTRTIGFVRGQAYDESPDDPIATVQAAFAINRAPTR
jgi:uncharacterized protein (TIGR00369 family)